MKIILRMTMAAVGRRSRGAEIKKEGGFTRSSSRATPLNLSAAVLAGLVALMVVSTAVAFPPAPHHTLYGMVRNQYGEPIVAFPSDVYL